MAPILFQHQGKVLSNELRTGDSALASSACEQPVIHRIQRDGGGFLLGECHESNMTARLHRVKSVPLSYIPAMNTPHRQDELITERESR